MLSLHSTVVNCLSHLHVTLDIIAGNSEVGKIWWTSKLVILVCLNLVDLKLPGISGAPNRGSRWA